MPIGSGDVVNCIERGTMIGIVLTQNDDGSLTAPTCPLEKCRKFKLCDISKNPVVVKHLQDKGL